MSTTKAPPPVHPDVSIVRLHGEACFWCGAAHTTLIPAGSVSAPAGGSLRIWYIVACPAHADRRPR
ncbi:hypothetical protein ACIBK8_17055 [Streptomyces sp. NPDC050161]|uniref:hypothetical protein n=1 Tax=Streptomyces sp. NPDC050161 TaxID=3365604 RepID=UPI00379B389C